MSKSLPLQLLIALIGGLFIGDYLGTETVRFFYTISCALKDILMWALPFIIFSYLFAAILSFKQRAPLLILFVLVAVICSNALSVLTAYGVGRLVLPWITGHHLQSIALAKETIGPFWSLGLAPLISPEKAMISSLLAGLAADFSGISQLKLIAFQLRSFATIALKRGFIPFLPLYVLGFVLKLDRDGALGILLKTYGPVFVVSCILIISYIGLLYLIASNFRFSVFLETIREMIPAGLTGFSTMSSAAAMPVTLAATEKNLKDTELADFIVPTTVNVHLIGDGLNIALTGLALLLMTGASFPSLGQYLTFTLFYCIAKFSCAGVPGGGVIVILPVLQTHLGLPPEATSLLATIYILQDPILTGANVMGNGAFALIIGKLIRRIRKKNLKESLSC